VNSADARVVAVPSKTVAHRASAMLVWSTHLFVLAVLVFLLGWLNAGAIANALQVWWVSPTYSHCFLVIPVSGYFVWRRRQALASVLPNAYPLALLLAPPLVLLSVAGTVAGINEIEQFAFIGLLQVLIAAVLGPLAYRRLLFPCLFLFFLIPTGDYLVAPLQKFTTYFVSFGLRLFGIAHVANGYIIELSNGTFEVAEACAGLRFLIATLAIGVLFVRLTYNRWHKAILFLLACFFVPVIANGFRALGIVLVAHWSDNRLAVGVDHIVYGWGFLVAILLVLMLIGMRYADPSVEEERWQASAITRFRPSALLLTAGLSVLVICSVPAFLHGELSRSRSVNSAMLSAPLPLARWESSSGSNGWSPTYIAPDARLTLAMRQSDSSLLDVDVFVNYYAGRHGTRDLLNANNKLWAEDLWRPLSDGTAETAIGSRPITVGESVIGSGGLKRVVWWTYWRAGRFTTSARVLKLEALRHVFSGGAGSALVALSTPAPGDLNEARVRLNEAFHALGAIPIRLDQISRD
jgi:exosortase A